MKMNLRNSFEPAFRKVHGILIYFKDKHTVVVSQGNTCILFHRWHDRERSSYEHSWKPFCRAMQKYNTLFSIYDITKLAEKYEVEHQTVTRTMKTLEPRGVKELPSVHVWRPKKNG